MEKLINGKVYNTENLVRVSFWECQKEGVKETLFFSNENVYLLHCEGASAGYTNSYGSKTFNCEDLMILDEEDVFGWLNVHDVETLNELMSDLQMVTNV